MGVGDEARGSEECQNRLSLWLWASWGPLQRSFQIYHVQKTEYTPLTQKMHGRPESRFVIPQRGRRNDEIFSDFPAGVESPQSPWGDGLSWQSRRNPLTGRSSFSEQDTCQCVVLTVDLKGFIIHNKTAFLLCNLRLPGPRLIPGFFVLGIWRQGWTT